MAKGNRGLAVAYQNKRAKASEEAAWRLDEFRKVETEFQALLEADGQPRWKPMNSYYW